MNQNGVLTRILKTRRDLETEVEDGTTYHGRILLVLYFIRYPQHSMNHRQQLSLSVMSETVFNFRTLFCPLGILSAKSGEFKQHDSLRLKQLLVYSCVTRDIQP